MAFAQNGDVVVENILQAMPGGVDKLGIDVLDAAFGVGDRHRDRRLVHRPGQLEI